MGQFEKIRVWITPPGTKLYGGRFSAQFWRDDPGIMLPDDYVQQWDPKKHRLYAMRGWSASLAVYNFVDDRWEGFFPIPEASSVEGFRARGLISVADKPYQDW